MDCFNFGGVWLEAITGQHVAHERDLVETKTTLLFAQGDTLIDTALEEGTDTCIVFFICSTPNNHIVSDTADSLKAFKSMM